MTQHDESKTRYDDDNNWGETSDIVACAAALKEAIAQLNDDAALVQKYADDLIEIESEEKRYNGLEHNWCKGDFRAVLGYVLLQVERVQGIAMRGSKLWDTDVIAEKSRVEIARINQGYREWAETQDK